MQRIVLGSVSPMKTAAAASVLERFLGASSFRLVEHAAPSGVPPTPHGDDTVRGARNRARDCHRRFGPAWCVGLESGLIERHGQLFEEAWACVIDPEGRESLGYSSGLRVPEAVLARMRQSGRTHAEVMEDVEREHGTAPSETWGTYSGGLLPRRLSLEEALRNALVPLLPSGLYKP
jgi:non-canonical (house-cleaning) NTP pyrophosphatase